MFPLYKKNRNSIPVWLEHWAQFSTCAWLPYASCSFCCFLQCWSFPSLTFCHIQPSSLTYVLPDRQGSEWWFSIRISQRKQGWTCHLLFRGAGKGRTQKRRKRIQLLDDLTGDRSYKALDWQMTEEGDAINMFMLVFTALHAMQTRYCDENSVRLSVHHTCALWQNGGKICPDLYTIRKNIYPTFLRRRMVGRGRPLLPEILGQRAPIRAKSPIFNQ